MFKFRRSIYLAVLLSVVSMVQAWDPPDTIWNSTYDNGKWDDVSSIIQTLDGGYLLGGSSIHSEPEYWTEYWLIKTDFQGNIIWENTCMDSTIVSSDCYTVLQTDDGSFLASGDVDVVGGSGTDIRVVKLDSSGQILLDERIGGPQDDICYDMVPTSDGGYIFGGASGNILDDTDFLILKTDSLFNVEWSETFGGPGQDIALSIIQTSDGGYLAGGRYDTFGYTADYYLVKTDADGNLEWTKRWGITNWDCIQDILQNPDGGYLVLGHLPYDDEGRLIKLDENGDIQWETEYDRKPASFLKTIDGGYVITGTYSSDLWLMMTDSVGNKIWETFVDGGSLNEVGLGLCETTEGGYIVAGAKNPAAGLLDYWLVCFDTCSGLNEGSSSTGGIQLSSPTPNPSKGPFSFTCCLTENSDILISVFDVAGHLIHRETGLDQQPGMHEYSWTPSSSLPNGSYMLVLETPGQRATERFVLIR